MKTLQNSKFSVQYIKIQDLKPATYNPRKHSDEAMAQLKESIERFGLVDPIVVNGAPKRKNIVIGGHFRLKAAKELGYKEMPVVYVNLPDIQKEKELNIRLNKNTGEWDWVLLEKFSEDFLVDVGFSTEELDEIFAIDDEPEMFDLAKELKKLNINKINVKKGDVWQLGEHRLHCGDSTIEADVLKLANGEKPDMCLTDPPYILDYLKGRKKGGKPIEGFGYKRDRKYLETDIIPDDFTEKWMANIHKV
ncbi:MAG TPA: ParB N-terminal domain-containing protein, partial [Candidatus Doudnabacteria bacterium]|nr:ParB N-terminal domain-containing protein [Candidatus Doudnabacteria bacterium]